MICIGGAGSELWKAVMLGNIGLVEASLSTDLGIDPRRPYTKELCDEINEQLPHIHSFVCDLL